MPSEIVTLRQKIADEYVAAQLGLSGLASGIARHCCITARQERIGVLHEALQSLVGATAIALVSDTLNRIPEQPTRQQVQHVLRYEFGETDDTTRLLTLLHSLWAQIDQLSIQVGVEASCKMVSAQPALTKDVIPS